MKATAARSAYRLRAVAILAALLCAFTVVAPFAARATEPAQTYHAHHRHGAHPVKVVNPNGSDQQVTTLRADQPIAGANAPRPIRVDSTVPGTADSLRQVTGSTPGAARTRGPPELA